MSIYTTSLSRLTTADLQELLDDGAVENVRLEFKLEVPSKDDTLKKLSSFANTFGGYMVIGARARSADGRIEDLPGVDERAGTSRPWCSGASAESARRRPSRSQTRSRPPPATARSAMSCTCPKVMSLRTS